jgi:predicted CoA-substrate-specific enzyme activase
VSEPGFLGIDIGSISTNFVLVSQAGEVLFDSYGRGGGNPIASVQDGLVHLEKAMPPSMEIAGVCTTGSGRELIGIMVGADVVKNEITAHARSAVHFCPDVRTIIEIGGQDSKVTLLREGAVVDFAMNLICAAGTGSFLDSQARRLEISIEDLSERSILSDNPTAIAGRCTVFAESDMIHKQQAGHAQQDILMGLCHALTRNFLSNVCRGKDLEPPLLLQGGVSANKGIVRAFQETLGFAVIVPEHHMVMGAYGAALIAAETGLERTRFRGMDVSSHEIATLGFDCEDCPNNCEIIEILDNDEVIGRSGGRCRKWEGTNGPRDELRESSVDVKPPSTQICAG